MASSVFVGGKDEGSFISKLGSLRVSLAFLRPKLKSKKVKDLYFTGQLTVPGPGVPPALISGNIVADMIAPL